ncbi:hypothetical protein KPL70_006839 [Citrus sinensis]|nr:hypothetical protein KPL70_006839 [Citrus sinensis]
MNMRPNWELKQCCNHEQFVFLVTVSVCAAVILALWRTILLKPFKLVTVFLHEASHAIACKLTCGKVLIYISMQVEGSQVHADEGGTTQTRGGVYCFILPAGLDTLRTLYSLRYCYLNVESSGFVIFLSVIWVLQETTDIRILRYIILFIGKCNSALLLSVLFSEVYHNASCVSDEESQLNNCRCDEQLVFSSCFILELNESTREMTIGLNGTWHGRSTGRIRTAQHDTSTFR